MKTSASINQLLAQLIVGRQLARDPSEWLYHSFDSLAQRTGIPPTQRLQLWLDIAKHHNQPHRYYHHLSHLYNLLQLAENLQTEIHAPDLLRWAVWFHDYIYAIGNPNNEVDSAQTAYNQLSPYLNTEDLLQVQELILATAGHQIPAVSEEFSLLQYKDCALFLDFDLAILAATPNKYQEYSQAVELEYTSIYPLDAYRQGRKAFIARFLERERLFYSPIFAPAEDRARQNLSQEAAS